MSSEPGPSAKSSGAGAIMGRKLGRYTLKGILGQGAMATVFRGRDDQLGRDVAIKVMNLAMVARAESAERFRREAQAVAALKHRGIVEVFDFAPATGDEPSYIVSEIINGPTLREFLNERRGRFLPEVAALVGARIAESLAVAHERGIVHRDVKPDNVMIERTGTRPGGSSRVVLTDFGVAHVTGLETMTATGALIGSPAYMSPEQARGQDVGPPADLWAMGVLLYEMATGHLPFAGKEPLIVIGAILRGTFKRPSQVNACVGREFENVILRCLEPDVAKRTASAAALSQELLALARPAGLADEGAALRRFMDDAEAVEAQLRPLVASQVLETARGYARRSEFARAMAEIGRATAYVPDLQGADALLRSLSSRRRWLQVTAAAAGSFLVGALCWGGWAVVRGSPSPVPTAVQSVRSVPHPSPAVVAIEALPPAPSPAASVPAQPLVATRPRAADKGRAASSKIANEPQAPAASGETKADAPAVAPPPSAVLALAVAPAALGTIRLGAQGGMCYPTLDDAVATVFRPMYERLQPGLHRVYCAENKEGPRQLVGEIDLPAGAQIEKTIRRDPVTHEFVLPRMR